MNTSNEILGSSNTSKASPRKSLAVIVALTVVAWLPIVALVAHSL